MANSQTENTSAGQAILGLILMVFTIYTPLYFFVFNDEIDAFQEASLIDMMQVPFELAVEGNSNAKKMVASLEDLLADARAASKKRSGVDLGISLEKALKKNDNISNIKWSYGLSRDSVSEIILTCNHKEYGTIVLSGIVKERSFLKFRFSKFLGARNITINGKTHTSFPAIAQTIYGLEGKELSNFTEMIRETSFY
ncbi:MAG: hypothetical protein DELT_01694 [Desulfovibrio sp.]